MWLLLSGKYAKWFIQYGGCVLVVLIMFVNWPQPDLSQRDKRFPVLEADVTESVEGEGYPEPVQIIEIDWEYTEVFEEYRVEVASDEGFTLVQGTFHGRKPPCFIPREFLREKGTYFYRVQVRESTRGWSVFSRPQPLELEDTLELRPVDPAIHRCMGPVSSPIKRARYRPDKTVHRNWYMVKLLSKSLEMIDWQSSNWLGIDCLNTEIPELKPNNQLTLNPVEQEVVHSDPMLSSAGEEHGVITFQSMDDWDLDAAGEEYSDSQLSFQEETTR